LHYDRKMRDLTKCEDCELVGAGLLSVREPRAAQSTYLQPNGTMMILNPMSYAHILRESDESTGWESDEDLPENVVRRTGKDGWCPAKW
jgi:hypothetical protein